MPAVDAALLEPLHAALQVRFVEAAGAKAGGIARGASFQGFHQGQTADRQELGRAPSGGNVTPFLRDVHYLAIVPDSPADIAQFVGKTLDRFGRRDWRGGTPVIGIPRLGDVREFCAKEGLARTLAVLDFNKEQVY